MQRKIFFAVLTCFALYIACFWLLFNLARPDIQAMQKKGKIDVLCTTSIITDAVKQIGGEYVRVSSLMGPGVDPHLYRARQGDIERLLSADIFFYNGLHLEGRMTEIFEKIKKWNSVIAVADCLPDNLLMKSDGFEAYDPHIWHDVSLWSRVIICIGTQLALHDPSHAAYYQQRVDQYNEKLQSLECWILQVIERIPPERRILVTAHDAFGYFGRAYGLRVVGLQGMSTDAEIGIRDISNISSYLVAHQVPVIFVESSIAPRSIEAVQQSCAYRGLEVAIGDELFSDALSDSNGPASTYIDMIQNNIKAIAKGLINE